MLTALSSHGRLSRGAKSRKDLKQASTPVDTRALSGVPFFHPAGFCRLTMALLRATRCDSAEEFLSRVGQRGPDPDVELVLAGLVLNLGGPVTVTDSSFA